MAWLPRFAERVSARAGLSVDQVHRELADSGYVVLRRFFEPEVVQDARTAAARLVDEVVIILRATVCCRLLPLRRVRAAATVSHPVPRPSLSSLCAPRRCSAFCSACANWCGRAW